MESLPNILVFQPDDLYQGYSAGWQAPTDPGFGLPVAPASLTPNIDRIGAEGAVFTAAYTASGMCAPSRLALLTGRYPTRGAYATSKSSTSPPTVTVPLSKMTAGDQAHNLPRALRSVGYVAGQFGKWHLSSDEGLQSVGCAAAASNQYGCSYEEQRATVLASGFNASEALYVSNLNTCGSTCMAHFSHNLEWMAAEALRFMHTSLAAGTPFFAYFNPTPPHQGSPTDGDWTANVLQDRSASSGFGPYYCTASPEGTLSDAWTAACAGSLTGAADFSAWCATCTMKTRQALWTDSSGVVTRVKERSAISAISWIDQSLGVLYDFLAERAVLDSTSGLCTTRTANAHAQRARCPSAVRVVLSCCRVVVLSCCRAVVCAHPTG